MSGKNDPVVIPDSLGEFLELKHRKDGIQALQDVHIYLRRRGQLFEQLKKWVTMSRAKGAYDAEHWKELQEFFGCFENVRFVARLNETCPDENQRITSNEHAVRLLVRTAQQSVDGSQMPQDDATLTHILKNMAQPSREAWTVIARWSFLSDPMASATVPVALHDKANSNGLLARLQVEIFGGELDASARAERRAEETAGIAANHPEQLLYCNFKPDLCEAVSNAFSAALANSGKVLHGRWRLLPWKDELRIEGNFSGESLSAAAVYGWGLLLDGCIVDPRVLIIAKVSSARLVEPLNREYDMAKKVKQVCEVMKGTDEFKPEAIDTIAVEGELDRLAAERAVGEAEMGHRIRIVEISSLKPRRLRRSQREETADAAA